MACFVGAALLFFGWTSAVLAQGGGRDVGTPNSWCYWVSCGSLHDTTPHPNCAPGDYCMLQGGNQIRQCIATTGTSCWSYATPTVGVCYGHCSLFTNQDCEWQYNECAYSTIP
jgi:hypothetical protein